MEWMDWNEIRQTYPHRWLLVEALEAHSQSGKRVLDDLAVADSFSDGLAAMKGYKELHHRAPERELYVLHTDREDLDIGESSWLGLRPALPSLNPPSRDLPASANPSRIDPMSDRESLRALIEELPEDEVHTALRFVEFLRSSAPAADEGEPRHGRILSHEGMRDRVFGKE